MLIDGAGAISDLESIAATTGGDLYVLASQSRSSKGKRPPARRLFMHLERALDGYKVTAQRDLFSALESVGPDVLLSLGISSLRDLDVEGMTVRDGGLLLGLKAPLDAEGQALIWRVDRPKVFLTGGTLQDAGLRLWQRVALQVESNGNEVPGGIAELLSLPDGSLLIAATVPVTDPERQSGALWWDANPGEKLPTGLRRLETFPGLKPEGLALSPTPGRLMITFDRGSKTPKWAERSRPTR